MYFVGTDTADMSVSVTDTADRVLIQWHLMTSEYCQRIVNYIVTITKSFSNTANSSLVTTVFGDIQVNITGLIPNQVYTVQVSAEVSSCESLTATRNFTTTDTSTTGTGKQRIVSSY